MTAPWPRPGTAPRIAAVHAPTGWGRTGVLVVIPARDEVARIEACLDALAGQRADALVVANNCGDATAARAGARGALVVEAQVPEGGVGAARRLGMAEGLARMPAPRALLTTDADCLVAPDWVARSLAHLDAGTAAVCGLVRPIEAEHAALPPALLRRAALEDRFLALKAALEERLTGRAGHEQTPGASLAFRPDAYRAAGGFDALPTGEDRAIVLRLMALGLRVVHDRAVTVRASCRMEGRAPGGMAAALRERAADPDAPLCPDLGRSEVPAVAAVLAGLGPLATPVDLPAAIAAVERTLASLRPAPRP